MDTEEDFLVRDKKSQRLREGHSLGKLFSELLRLLHLLSLRSQPAALETLAEPESLPLLRVPPLPHCFQMKIFFPLSFKKVLSSEGF